MLEFATAHVVFPSVDDTDRNVVHGHATLHRKLIRDGGAQVAIQGIRMEYDNGDHHVLKEQVGVENVRAQAGSNDVEFDVFLGLSDESQNFYSGAVMALVIAEVQ
jgi:hypothetical protein